MVRAPSARGARQTTSTSSPSTQIHEPLPSPQHAPTLTPLTTAHPHSYFPHHSTPSLLDFELILAALEMDMFASAHPHSYFPHHSTPSLLLPSPQHVPTFTSWTTARPRSYFPHHSTPSLLLPSPQHALTLTSLLTLTLVGTRPARSLQQPAYGADARV